MTTAKRILALLLCLVMCIGMLPAAAFAEEEISADPISTEPMVETTGEEQVTGVEAPLPERISEVPEEEAAEKTDAGESDDADDTEELDDILPDEDVAYLANGSNAAGKRINELIEKMAGKVYFTVNEYPCYNPGKPSHGCPNCDMRNVIKERWLSDLLDGRIPGSIYRGGFKHYYYSKSITYGESCMGFANFAGWYIFAEDNDSVVTFAKLKDGRLDYDTLKDARPGDILCMGNVTNKGSHSAVFLSCDTSGVTVLDCNTNNEVVGNCLVREHKYNFEKPQYKYVTISRAEGIVPDHTVSFDANGGSGSMKPICLDDGETFRVPSNSFSNGGDRFLGWKLYRNSDAKWYVADKGWKTDSEISEELCFPTLFREGQSVTLDDTWVSGTDGTGDYTFYAVWESPLIGGICGDKLRWHLFDDGELVFSGSGDMYDFTVSEPASWDIYKNRITTVSVSAGVTHVGKAAFYGYTGIKRVSLSEGVKSIGDMAFYGCSGLTGKLTIPSSVRSIGLAAFFKCTGLTGVTIDKGVTEIGQAAFAYCSGLTDSLTIPASVTDVGSDAFRDCRGLTELTVSSGMTDISNAMFYGCSALTKVTLPSSVTAIGRDAFYGCTALKNVYYSGTERQWKAITVGGNNDPLMNAALHCKEEGPISGKCGDNLTWTLYEGVLKISGTGAMYDDDAPWDELREEICALQIGSGVTHIGDYAFYDCGSLTGSLTIPSGVTSIGDYAFAYCSGLTGSLTIPSGVTSIGIGAFEDCCGLTGSLTIPLGVTNIGFYAFEGCSGLTGRLTIPSGITHIDEHSFYGCSGLTELTIPSGVTGIGDGAFEECCGLKELVIPEGVRNVGEGTFAYCSALQSVTIPASMTSIGDGAFYSCGGLKDVYYSGTESQWASVSIGEGNDPLKNATLHFGIEIVASGICGDNLTWILYGNGLLEIDGTGAMYDYEPYPYANPAPWCYQDTVISSVQIDSGVTHIGSCAFFEHTGLTGKLTIPSGVTSIGDHAFYCCGLTSVTVPSGVTSIGDYAFSLCSGLTEIKVSSANPSFRSIDGVLFNKNATKLITFPGGVRGEYSIPSSVTSIGDYAFSCCTGLTGVMLPSGLTGIGNAAFYGCTGLTGVTIPSGVTDIENAAFYGCTGLTGSLTIPSSVMTIGDSAFYRCIGLRELTLSEGVTSIGISAFNGCNSLMSATIPSSVISIGGYAFYDCRILTNLTIAEGVMGVNGYAFYNCGMTELTIPSSMKAIGQFAFASCSRLASVTILPGTSVIGACAFAGCSELTKLTIPVAAIGDYAFEGCSGLTGELTIPEGVTSIGMGTFYNCSGLTSVKIPSSVTAIGAHAFSDCTGLTGFNVSSDNPSFKSIDGVLFSRNATELIAFPGGRQGKYSIPDSTTDVGAYAFACCSGLTEVTIPSGVTGIGDSAFEECCGLTEVTIPWNLASIGDYAFANCSGLKDVYFMGSEAQWEALKAHIGSNNDPLLNATIHVHILASGECGDGLTWTLDENGLLKIEGTGAMADYDYYGLWRDQDTAITAVEIGSGVTHIGSYAFEYLDALTSVTIPLTVTSIGDYAFLGCDQLERVNTESIEAWCGISFDNEYANPLYYAHEMYINGERQTSVTIPSGVTEIGDMAFIGWSGLTSVTLSPGVTGIGIGAFYECSGLTEITIPEGVTHIGIGAFYSCSALTEVTIPESVQSIGYVAFEDCDKLERVNAKSIEAWCGISFDNEYANPLYYAHEMYINGERQTSVTIPSGVTAIGSLAFVDWSGLTSVTIPESVQSIGYGAFDGCGELNDVYYLGSYKQWIDLTTGIPDRNDCLLDAMLHVAFASGGCGDGLTWTLDENGLLKIEGTGAMDDYNTGFAPWYGLRASIIAVEIGSGVTHIGDYAFADCIGLTEITIPESIQSIGCDAFEDCDKLERVNAKSIEAWCGISFDDEYANPLYYAHEMYIGGERQTSVTIPSGVTEIGSLVFAGWSGLASVTIPESMQSVGYAAFFSCSGLKDVYYLGSYRQWNALWARSGDRNDRLFSAAVHAYILASGVCGDGLTWTLNENGLLKIEGTGAMDDYSVGFAPWYGLYAPLIAVEIGSGVTHIGDYAFYECSGLTDVTIPASVTSIGKFAFSECSGLTDVTIPASVTSIGKSAFSQCGKLEKVNVESIEAWCGISFEDIDANPLCYAHEMYINGERQTSVTIPSGVTAIGDMAFICWGGLTSATISPGVTDIGSFAFGGCAGLTEITIPASVKHVGKYAFSECGKLERVNAESIEAWCGISFGDESANPLYYAHEMYIDGERQTSVTIPSGMTGIGDMAFAGWSGLTSATISSGVTDVGTLAFYECSGLTEITIPQSVNSIGYRAFEGCDELNDVYYLGSRKEWNALTAGIGDNNYCLLNATIHVAFTPGECGVGLTWTLDENGLLKIEGTGAMDAYSTDGAPWYGLRALIRTVEIGNGVSDVGSYAFADCSELTEVTIPASVKHVGMGAFYGCGKLEKVHVQSLSEWCGIRFDDEYANPLYYAHEMYINGERQTSVTIPSGVPMINNRVFFGWSGLTSVTIPSTVHRIGIASFCGCSGLTSIAVPNSVESIGGSAFKFCSGLTDVTLSSSLLDIAVDLFCGCSGLTELKIPDRVMSISGTAFSGCGSLKSISLPTTLHTIGTAAFTGCIGLEDVYYSGTEEQWDALKAGTENYNDCLFNAALHFIGGDLTGDGTVDGADVLLLMDYVKARGVGVTLAVSGDLTGDGGTDTADILRLMKLIYTGSNQKTA